MTGNVVVSESLSSLLPNTTYHYRVVAENSLGISRGNDVPFTTESLGSAPTVSTDPADSITSTSAMLTGTVNPNGLSTQTYFQWGTSTSYGNTTPSQSIGGGTSNVSVAAMLSSLSPSTTYHYRVVASNSAGTKNGLDATFTTLRSSGPPMVLTSSVTNVTMNSAQLNGIVNPNGSPTSVYFQWGITTSYGNVTASQSIGSDTTKINVTDSLTSLSPNTRYYCVLVATNRRGTTYGDSISFTTASSGNPATPITLGQTITGTLGSYDGQSRIRGDRYYADHYSFVAPTGQPAVVYLNSPDFDTYLYLFLPDTSVLAEDNDGGGGKNSRIPSTSGLVNLPTNGTYMIEVTSFDSIQSGRYTLSLSSAVVSSPPSVTTDPATDVASRSATLNGSVNPNGSLTTAWFEIGTNATLTPYASTPAQLLNSETTSQRITYVHRDLAANTEYFYRIAAQNIAGMVKGSVEPITTITSVMKVSHAIPDQYSLSQNFPNPFNPTTDVEFSLPKSNRVVLMIYNTLGIRVETLVDEVLMPGTYRYQWNGMNLPSGVYFYRIMMGSFVETKRMLLVR